MDLAKRIDELVAAGRTKEAVVEVYNAIKTAVTARNFAQAEQLRERLMAIDSMALTEIIGAAELIEEAKAIGIDPDHQRLWRPLLETLSPEEANAFFYALQPIDLPPGTPIIEQGKLNNRLFFICQGQVNVIFKKPPQQMLLYHLGEGETAGEETIFDISVATATFICHSLVKLRYLERQTIQNWENDFPGLKEKILIFCKKHGHLDSTINAKLHDRRSHERFRAKGRLTALLFTAPGKPLGSPFYGSLVDLSQDGLCFALTCSSKTAQILLGRQINLKLSAAGDPDNSSVNIMAIIVGVQNYLHNDYTLHVKFQTALDRQVLKQLVDPSRR